MPNFSDCMQSAMDDGHVDKERGEYAQRLWRDTADQYQRAGYNRHQAETLAAEDVQAALKREATLKRHEYLTTMAVLRERELEVKGLNVKQMKWHLPHMVETLGYEERGLRRYFDGRIKNFLLEHHADLLGRVTKPAQLANVVRELHGERTGDETAQALAQAVGAAREDQRLMFNAAGGNIGKLENWGLAHTHDWGKVTSAGFESWFADLHRDDGTSVINWSRIEDELTGRPLQPPGAPEPSEAIQRRFLKEVWDNIAYGKGTKEAVYGRKSAGMSTEGERVLHFRTADDWIRYNARYGQGTAFNAIVNQMARMSRRIAEVRRFSIKPDDGLDFVGQVLMREARDRQIDPVDAKLVEASVGQSRRMLNVLRGPVAPKGRYAQWAAAFFGGTREVLRSAFLDRSVIISALSDSNLSRMAMTSLDINPANMLATYGKLMKDSLSGGGTTRDELLQQEWIASSLANPNVSMDRFQTEYPGHTIAKLLSAASMRIQGHLAHTDNLMMALQHSIAAKWATEADKPLDQLPTDLRGAMQEHGITADDWDVFRRPDGIYTAGNGARFLNPLWWRHSVNLPREESDRLFTKFQSFMERWTEVGVPGRNLFFSGMIDPSAHQIPPGTVQYELMKSLGMFKSVVGSMLVGQYRMMMMRPTAAGRASFAAEAAVTDTLVGALAIQIGDVLMGRDPQGMDPRTHPGFIARAFVKGGALGPVGDILSQGQSSFGGGLANYVAGPMVEAGQDAMTLSLEGTSYLAAFALGKPYGKQRTAFAKEIARLGKRYTPMGQTPLLAGGAAMDRLIWDQMQIALDPNSVAAMVKKAARREKVYGQGQWWPDELAAPNRAPDLRTALR